jgi:hypothetical protein
MTLSRIPWLASELPRRVVVKPEGHDASVALGQAADGSGGTNARATVNTRHLGPEVLFPGIPTLLSDA